MERWLADTTALQTGTYGYQFDTMPIDEKIQYIKDMIVAATDELHEALAETGWKPWATERFINREAFIGELIDVEHFLANLFVAVGCTDEEHDEAYAEKRTRNIKRQDDGYTGLDKCKRCSRAFDDIAAKTSQRLGTTLAANDMKKIILTPKGPETVCIPCASDA